MMRKFTLAGVIPALMLCACKNTVTQDQQAAFTIQNDTIHLHSADQLMERVKLTRAETRTAAREIITAGSVQAIPTRFAYIAPPFGGRVVKSHVVIGQSVAYNQPLFEINSPDFTALQKEYFQAKSSYELALKDLNRKKELLAGGVCSTKEFEEATNAYDLAGQEYENFRSALRVYHVNPDKTVLGEPFIVRAPLAGNILDNYVVTGQYIAADAESVAVVADLREVWITAQVKEKDIRFIHEGDEMIMHVDAFPGRVVKGTVYHVEESVDEDTRSIKVLSICKNPDEELKLGMYATVHFYGREEQYAVLSEKAVMQGENESYVLTQLSDDCLVRRAVKVDFTRDGLAYISSGLSCDEKVIGQGGYYFQ